MIPRIYAARLPGEKTLETRYQTTQPELGNDYAYWQGIADLWAYPWLTLINVEHDIEYSDQLAAELLACRHPRCAYAYQMLHQDVGPYWAFSPDGLCGMQHWGTEGDQWAAHAAIGFCKIEASARGPIPARSPWLMVEQNVNVAVRKHAGMIRGTWHIHWGPDGHGIKHFHTRENHGHQVRPGQRHAQPTHP